MSYATALRRALCAVEKAMGVKHSRPRRKRQAPPAHRLSIVPAPAVLSEALRASVEEGLITEAEAWSLTERPELSLRGVA